MLAASVGGKRQGRPAVLATLCQGTCPGAGRCCPSHTWRSAGAAAYSEKAAVGKGMQ